jgi:hypothetical protein
MISPSVLGVSISVFLMIEAIHVDKSGARPLNKQCHEERRTHFICPECNSGYIETFAHAKRSRLSFLT